MNILDIIIIIIMVISICYSTYRGFIRDIFSLLGLAAGFITASQFYLAGGKYLQQWFDNPAISNIVSFIAILIGVTFTVSLLGTLARRTIRAVSLGWLDRLLGACFGFFKGLLIICTLLMILVAFLPPQKKILTESKFSPRVITLSKVLTSLVPDDLKINFREKQQLLMDFWTKKALSAIPLQSVPHSTSTTTQREQKP